MMDYELLRAALDTACAEKVAQSDEDTNGYRYDACGKKMDGCGKGKGKGECKGKECDSCKKTSCDGCKVKDACGGKKCSKPTLDAVTAAAEHAAKSIQAEAVQVVQQWASDDGCEDGNCADSLLGNIMTIATQGEDRELTDDDQEVLDIAAQSAYDYLCSKGVDQDDAYALLSDGDEDAANRVRDYLMDALPEGEDAEDDDVTNFVFSDEENEPALDAAIYKRGKHLIGGKLRSNFKVKVGGVVTHTQAQKAAYKKRKGKKRRGSSIAKFQRAMQKRKAMGL